MSTCHWCRRRGEPLQSKAQLYFRSRPNPSISGLYQNRFRCGRQQQETCGGPAKMDRVTIKHTGGIVQCQPDSPSCRVARLQSRETNLQGPWSPQPVTGVSLVSKASTVQISIPLAMYSTQNEQPNRRMASFAAAPTVQTSPNVTPEVYQLNPF